MAIKYKKFFLGHVDVIGNENKQLGKIINEAKITTRQRYTSTDGKLKQVKPIPEALRSPKKIMKKEEKREAICDDFLKENQDVENDKKYARFVDNIAKINPDNGKK
jgi:phosphoglycerol transferase MdoB-like AlkP superfamily enzyme